MATSAKTPKKRATTSKKTIKSTKKVQFPATDLRNPRTLLFAVSFAVVGVFLLLQASAKPALLAGPDEVVAAYYDSKPTLITQAEGGSAVYESYTASYLVLGDGTLLCDDGNQEGFVQTGQLGLGEVKNLHQEIRDLKLEGLPNETGVAGQEALISTHEGFVINGDGKSNAFSVHAGAAKPDKLAKMQAKILSRCEKATTREQRGKTKEFRLPTAAASTQSVLQRFSEVLVPKVAAQPPDPVSVESNYATNIFNLTNQRRASLGIYQYQRRGCMNELANLQAKRQAEQNKLYHNSNLVNEFLYVCNKEGATSNNWRSVGENCSQDPNNNSQAIFNAYVNSSGHRANLDHRTHTRTGSAAYRNQKNNYIYSTQVFANWP
ncbi:hypothetical protein H0X10_00980 [Candidatus Saccharibacteria bacterium]|nr:hypothetical protein [Candidatus Saccharibacteria bacterium]